MKKITFLITLFMVALGYSQVALPYDFETSPVTGDVTSFDGAVTTVEAVMAPQSTGNASTNLMKMVRNGGQVWAGAFILTASNFDFSSKPFIQIDIWTEAPIGTKIMLKTEQDTDAGNNSGEKDVFTTVTSAWESLIFDFTGVANANQNKLVFIPANGILGDGSGTSTFFIDNVINTAVASTKDFVIEGLNVFPNPSQDNWTIKTKNIKMASIEVFDLLGKNVMSIKPNLDQATIDGSGLRTGLYFAQIKTANGTGSIKLIKQ